MKKLIILATLLSAITSCTHTKMQTHKLYDEELNCTQLRTEMTRVSSAIEDVDSKTGLSGRNVGMALIFWPGILVNEVNGSDALKAANHRMDMLVNLYNRKGCTNPNTIKKTA